MCISEFYIDSENIFQFYFLFIFFFKTKKNYSKYTAYVGKHYCYKANVMYFFTISMKLDTEQKINQRSKYLQSFKTNSYPILLRKQGYRFDIKGLKVAK